MIGCTTEWLHHHGGTRSVVPHVPAPKERRTQSPSFLSYIRGDWAYLRVVDVAQAAQPAVSQVANLPRITRSFARVSPSTPSSRSTRPPTGSRRYGRQGCLRYARAASAPQLGDAPGVIGYSNGGLRGSTRGARITDIRWRENHFSFLPQLWDASTTISSRPWATPLWSV